jgi:hypothetical protein
MLLPRSRSSGRRTRQRLADGTSCGTGSARLMRTRLLTNANTTDAASEDKDYEVEEDDDPAYVPPPVPPVAVTVHEESEYGTNRLTRVGRDWLLEKCVKEDVFPKIKFANLMDDLDFSNNPNSICRFVAAKMKISEETVEGWWESSKKLSIKNCTRIETM